MERFFIGSASQEIGNLHAVNAETGSEEWRFNTGGAIVSSPTVLDETVFVGNNDHNLYAVDTDTGNQQWAFDTGEVIQESSPTVADGSVFVGTGIVDVENYMR